MILVFLGAVAIILLAIVIVMVWGAVASLIHAGKIIWRFFVNSMRYEDQLKN